MVIVATDASVRCADGSAFWAAVIQSDNEAVLLRLRGQLPVSVADSCHAELVAIYRALSATARHESVQLIVDNDRVVAWLRGTTPPPRLARLVRSVRRMLRRRNGVVRWTKGHAAHEHPLHREADRLARKPLEANLPPGV